jgi:hypothetical protein
MCRCLAEGKDVQRLWTGLRCAEEAWLVQRAKMCRCCAEGKDVQRLTKCRCLAEGNDVQRLWTG